MTRPGASHGPRAVRDASAHFAFGEYYHYDYDVTISDYLTIVDCGDIDAVAGNAARTFERAAAALDEIYAASCLPVLIGGDHADVDPGRPRARAAHRRRDGLRHVRHASRHGTGHRRRRALALLARPPRARPPNVDGRNVVIIGAHGAANPKSEKDVADAHGVTVFSVRDIDRLGIDEVARPRRRDRRATAPRRRTSRSTSTCSTARSRGAPAGRRSAA